MEKIEKIGVMGNESLKPRRLGPAKKLIDGGDWSSLLKILVRRDIEVTDEEKYDRMELEDPYDISVIDGLKGHVDNKDFYYLYIT